MATEITERTAQPADLVQRNSFMAALSLAEQLMSETTALPTDFTVAAHPWTPNEPELRFYFHHDVAGLRQFRDDQMLTETMTTREDGSVYVEATREDVRGVRVVAWTLSNPAASAVAA